MTVDRDPAAAEGHNEGEPDPKLSSLLNDYREAIERGRETEPQEWASNHPEGKERLEELQAIDSLHDTFAVAEQDSHGARLPTLDFPANDQPGRDQLFLKPGLQLQQCRIERFLDHGGMGEVYLAQHLLMQRQVAVKVLRDRLTDAPAASERFLREVRLLATLNPHPNLAAAFDAGVHEGHYYLVMEYVPGIDLKKHVAQTGPLPVDQACAFVRQAALGLDYLHEHGLVHRDIKPSNLMLTPKQEVKILDLGLARRTATRASDQDASLTTAGAVLGTLDYLAPEQADDAGRADARSDLYSLSCTFYHLLTGRPPFAHCARLDKLAAHARDNPSPVQELRPEVPKAIAAVVHQLLAKDPAERYSSARAFIQALDEAVASSAAQRTTLSWSGNRTGRPPWNTRRLFGAASGRWAILIGLLLVLGTALLAGVGLLALRREQPQVLAGAVLKDLEIRVRRERNDKRIALHSLLVDGREQELKAIDPPLGPEDDFTLTGDFDRSTYWYLLWFDTAGVVTVAEHGKVPGTRVQYPEWPNMQEVDRTNPLGVHVLLLAASTVHPDQVVRQVEARFKNFGKTPPSQPPERWALRPRGPGRTNPGPANLAAWQRYLGAIESKLPPGLKPAQWIFLQTRR
jgi:tRNA A-37 threonylcarbamoyl transferase component Bud32